eukprot:CAMPEP_0119319378 /NCGR_PEP_ID=MMETSP1333-20130426/49215_1 /TAXON_ID=418940 /ORGANISM="Scyphosphaera apsteinii, Strain RCC1455" /LENGTH=187 /DNA_ID=CAMNT_0007325767 /DNA_START=133 /DNA_END=696 /DNA_ORIENTATION=+
MVAAEEVVELVVDYLEGTPAKLLKTSATLTGSSAAVLVPLRIAAGVLMIHHGSEGGIWPANSGSDGFEGFVEYIVKPYFYFLPGSPAVWSAVHDYIEFWGGVLVALGLFTRPVSALLFVTMLGAVYFHLASTGVQGFPLGHVENYSYNFEEPTLYACIFLMFAVLGAGPLSADEKLYANIVEGLDNE